MTVMVKGDEQRNLLVLEHGGKIFVWPFPFTGEICPGLHYETVWMFESWEAYAQQLTTALDQFFGAKPDGVSHELDYDFIDASGGWTFDKRPAEGWGPRSLETLAKVAPVLLEAIDDSERDMANES